MQQISEAGTGAAGVIVTVCQQYYLSVDHKNVKCGNLSCLPLYIDQILVLGPTNLSVWLSLYNKDKR